MKQLKEIIQEKLVLNKNSKVKYNYHPKDRNELKELIKKLIRKRGKNADLNDIDTSKITDMSNLFSHSNFGGDISNFNGDISNWDVSNVKNMECMFRNSKFNGDISNWDVSNVENMNWMFNSSNFNGDISKWDVSNIKDMDYMFNYSPLKDNPPKWYKESKWYEE